MKTRRSNHTSSIPLNALSFVFGTLFVLTIALSVNAAPSARLSKLLGHPVTTDNGDALGRIEDIALDPVTGEARFVVVSIGSFLVENSLIAVSPDAVARVANGEAVILPMADLEVAHRFNADSWPENADVGLVAGTRERRVEDASATAGAATTTPLASTGSATITAGKRSATFSNGKREIINGPIRTQPAAVPAPRRNTPQVVANFKSLDRNRDGRLSRAEIGAQLNQQSGFGSLDSDSNGSIDDFEYQAYVERIARERRWAGNRGGINSIALPRQ